MKKRKGNISLILLAIIIGVLMFLVDVFLSMNSFKLMFLAGIGIVISILIIFYLNKKNIEYKKDYK